MTRTLLLSLGVIAFALSNNASAQEFQVGTPNPNIPELTQLRRFEGKWEAGVSDSQQKVTSSRKWLLNGSFLKHDFELSGGDVHGAIYRGYDKTNARYTMTVFDSTGNVSSLAGYWDEGLNTMVFDAIDNSCIVQKYESYFPDEKTEQWTITLNNGSKLSATAKKSE